MADTCARQKQLLEKLMDQLERARQAGFHAAEEQKQKLSAENGELVALRNEMHMARQLLHNQSSLTRQLELAVVAQEDIIKQQRQAAAEVG